MNIKDLESNIHTLSLPELEHLMSWVGDYEAPLVDIEQFFDDTDYLGTFFQGELRTYWREFVKKIYPSPYYDPYYLIALRGSIGKGKTTIACACGAYEVYRLLQRINPQKSMGLIPSSKMVFAIFNRTLSLSTDVVWDKFSQIFTRAPYFYKMLGPLGTRRKDRDTLFPKRIDFLTGSRIGHSLGSDVFFTIFDEANFDVVEDQVQKNFNSTLSRMESRFMKPGGGVNGKIFVVSSESDKFSTMNSIVDGYKSKNGILVDSSSLWECVTHKNNVPIYSGNRFWVFKGSETKPPELLHDTSVIIAREPDNCIHVPVEHRDRFETDIHSALRDIAGVATGSTYKLFKLKDRFVSSMVVEPIFPDTIQLDFDNDIEQIIDFCSKPEIFTNVDYPRYIHLDMGLSGDRLGMSSSYVRGFKERKVRDINTYQEFTEVVPEVVTEWVTGLEAVSGKQIPLYKVRLFLLQISRAGYMVGKVTADLLHMSADTLQGLTKVGFETEYLSVDRSVVPYMDMRVMVYEGRLFLPNSNLLKKESLDLEVLPDGTKVDHPHKGSKDLSDSVAGSSYTAAKNADKNKLLYMVSKNTKSAVVDMFWNRAANK